MRTHSNHKIWFIALLVLIFAAGCGDPDKSLGPGNPLSPPTVISVTPSPGFTLVCPNIAVISATFSKPMNPATINTSTFTLSGPGGAVTGIVTVDSTGTVATFTPPAASLTPSTMFTATITTGVADTFGNHLAANFVWSFTTSGPCLLPPPAGLGTACNYGVLAATPVLSNVVTASTPPNPTVVTGNIGIFPACSITGFVDTAGPGTFTGTEHKCDIPPIPANAKTAQDDMLVAFNNAMNAGGGPSVGIALTADIGGQTLPPGIYIAPSTLGITGTLFLDGSTNPNGVWIFKVPSSLTTASGSSAVPASQVKLIGGAQAHNVFWAIAQDATLGTWSLFQGTILCHRDLVILTGATLDGRALANTGKVTLDNNKVNVPACP
ncbi:MAG TPA: ice-binding family protein [Candidatus Acidoferrales bacterium]|nr:ice-binding family protein [Candidatus Acidoferrales bacterium]